MTKENSVLILDFGSQYTQLIARRTRELGVFSEIKPCTVDCTPDLLERYGAVILSGGPSSVTDHDAPRFDKRWVDCELPMLGICYGLQLFCYLLGAKLGQGKAREYGKSQISILKTSALFSDFAEGEHTQVWMSHGDHVEEVPTGFELLATSTGAPIAAIGNEKKKIYAVQFHPEVVHSIKGKEVLKNFLFKVANLQDTWRPENFVDANVASIQKEMANYGNVICGISGGVDSTVAALLVHKALGKRLTCIFVDNGLLRESERDQVESRLSELGLNLIVVDATEEFLSALAGVTDPEAKRKAIGRVFIEIFDSEAKKIPNVTHLVQGTLYPDVIESVSVRGPSAVIKSHHNVGGLPEKMHLKLLEPLRELFKDEVRAVGRMLNAPANLIERQPFPGPGLAVRCLGEVTKARLTLLRKADAIFQEEIRNAGLYGKLWQSFCVLLPVKSVGVMGDGRTYEETCGLRAVTSQDGMTADWYYLPEELLKTVSNRIINEVKGINRVVLDISSKPPATIEWE